MIIGIDGLAGTGKTTIAKIFEEKYNIKYINTGAMYRALAYKCLQNRIEKEDETDKNKTVGALKRTENQKYIDTTDKKIDDVITEILGEIERIRKDNVR